MKSGGERTSPSAACFGLLLFFVSLADTLFFAVFFNRILDNDNDAADEETDHCSEANRKHHRLNFRHSSALLLHEEVIVSIALIAVVEVIFSLRFAAEGLAVLDFLNVLETAGDAFIPVGIKCVEA